MYNYKEIIPHINPVTPYFKRVDKLLLINLMKFQTPTRDGKSQDKFLTYIEQWGRSNIKDLIFERDTFGNLYITKGVSDLYPAVVSHVDIVHSYNKNLKIVDAGNLIIGLDMSTGEQHGIGADPKNGVYFALEMLRTLDKVKIVLYKMEEQGCIGSSASDISFFQDCSFIVQLDRRSFTNDIIEYTNGIQVLSEEFKNAVAPIGKKYDYKFNRGTCTDVGTLVQKGVGICAFNFSNGSINEHMDNEVCSIPHLLNALNGAYDIIISLGYKKRWEHTPQKEVSKPKFPSKYTDKWDDWYDEPIKKKVYHHSDHVTFTKEDEATIQDAVEVGDCPICSNHVVDLEDGESVCVECESVFNIPEGKGLTECLVEFDELVAKL
jgi:tripeptide aminopeptidase